MNFDHDDHPTRQDPACAHALLGIAERIGDPDAGADDALTDHLLTCSACRAAATDMEEAFAAVTACAVDESVASAPPTDLAALHRAIRRTERPATLRRIARGAVRAAAVLLAAVGVAALFSAEIETDGSRVALSFALPGTARPPEAPPLETVIDRRVARVFDPGTGESPVRRAVNAELRPHLEDLAHWFVDVDRRREEDLEFLAAWLDRRRQDDAATLARQLIETRARLEDTERVQSDLLEVLAPRLDAVRFEPR